MVTKATFLQSFSKVVSDKILMYDVNVTLTMKDAK